MSYPSPAWSSTHGTDSRHPDTRTRSHTAVLVSAAPAYISVYTVRQTAAAVQHERWLGTVYVAGVHACIMVRPRRSTVYLDAPPRVSRSSLLHLPPSPPPVYSYQCLPPVTSSHCAPTPSVPRVSMATHREIASRAPGELRVCGLQHRPVARFGRGWSSVATRACARSNDEIARYQTNRRIPTSHLLDHSIIPTEMQRQRDRTDRTRHIHHQDTPTTKKL